MLNIDNALELALHRALRGEIPPCVYAITADLSARPIELHIYSYGDDCAGQFEEVEVIESEMEQCLPKDVERTLAHISYSFHEADGFDISSDLCLLYRNHQAKTD